MLRKFATAVVVLAALSVASSAPAGAAVTIKPLEDRILVQPLEGE